jgi:hypothetical protein
VSDYSLKKPLTSFGLKLLIPLLVIDVTLAVLHVITQEPGTLPFWTRLFRLDTEYGLSSTYSSTLLLATSLTSFLIGLRAGFPRLWQRLFWWFLAALFAYLCLDEYLVIHETIIAPAVGPVIHWPRLFILIGVILAVFIAAVYWTGFRGDPAVFAMLLGGLAIAASGGLGVESLNYFFFCVPRGADWGLCNQLNFLEEGLEMIGDSIILAGLVSFAQARLSASGWRLAKRVFAGGSALWFAAIVGSIWLLPTFEARLLAQPVEAEFVDGDLSLVGYRISQDVLAPGDELTLKLYWQAHQRLPENYYFSAHLLTRPGATSVAQGDMPLGGWLGWHASTWVPGVVMRDTIRIDVPGYLPTPGSYWLILRVWWPTKIHRKGDPILLDEIIEVPVTQSDRQLLKEDTMVLDSLPALSETAPPEPLIEANYRFADGFSLYGYSLPSTVKLGEPLTLEFWWQAETDVDPELVQFIHLLPGDRDHFSAYDQPPFGESFPTSDWPAGMQVRDVRSIPLADDLPPGEYRVHTGMYVLETGERRPVTDADGQPVQDYSIYLGTVTLER